VGAYSEVTRRLRALRVEGARVESYGAVDGEPLLCVHASAAGRAVPTVLLTAGVHGDEPAGVEAAIRFLEEELTAYTPCFDWLVAPCVNPAGYAASTRENAAGADINRAFDTEPTPESTALKTLLVGRRFACAVDFHEDWEAGGFYMYEGVLGAAAAGAEVTRAVAEIGDIDLDADPDDPPLSPGVYAVPTSWGTMGLAPYLLSAHTGHAVITETPSRAWGLEARVQAHLCALRVVLDVHAGGRAAR
jgi:murein peptide amidase A